MFNCLVVDDDVEIGLFISRLLEKKFNCRVEKVTDGITALTRLKTYLPEVIFLDVTMPGMDGIKTLETIKSSDKFKNIPVIMITAISERDTVMKAMEMGAVAYILKPLVFLPVYEKIKEIFSKIKSEKNIIDSKTFSNKDFEMSKILVIDDDKNFVDRITSGFDENYLILSAANGIDGLAIFNDEKPEIVIVNDKIDDIDIKMLSKRMKDIAQKDISFFVINDEEKLTSEEKKLWDLIIKK